MRGIRSMLSMLLALVAVVALAACGGGSDSASETTAAAATTEAAAAAEGDKVISLVAYSTPREVYEMLIPAFQGTPDGDGVEFEQSYGSSGEQSRAVEAGLPADYVAFSLEPDVTRLVDAGLVAPDWQQTEQYNGMVTDSVVVFVVREGNPKNIQTWDDLVTGEVEVVTPNPFTSGGAQWNLMAAYGAQLEQGKTEEEALEYLRQLLQQHAGAGQERPRGAADLLGRQGRRAPRLRERGDLRPAGRRADRLRRARPDDPDREPGRRDRQRDARDGRVARVRPDARRADGLRRERLPAGRSGRRRRVRLPAAVRPVHDRRPRRLADVREKFFDRDDGIVAGIEQELGVPTDG